MDNAAKAIIIAGGILIALLVISLSMYLYTAFQDAYERNMQVHSAYQINMFNTNFTKYGFKEDGSDVLYVAGSDAYNILSRAYEENSSVDSIVSNFSVSGKAMDGGGDFSLDKGSDFYFEKVFYFSEAFHWKYRYSYTFNEEGAVDSVTLEWVGNTVKPTPTPGP